MRRVSKFLNCKIFTRNDSGVWLGVFCGKPKMRHRNESVVFFYCSVFLKTKQRARISLLMLWTCLSQTFSY